MNTLKKICWAIIMIPYVIAILGLFGLFYYISPYAFVYSIIFVVASVYLGIKSNHNIK